MRSTMPPSARWSRPIPRNRCRLSIRMRRRSSPSPSTTTKASPNPHADDAPAAAGSSPLDVRVHRVRRQPAAVTTPLVVAILGPTATGKSALALALAEQHGGEIINCDSTAVYRGFDIGTDKLSVAERRGIAHHLIDIVEPTEEYTAAHYARDAAAAIGAIHARGRLPILAGGTGLYYRALTRGLFPGPGRDAELRGRLEAVAARRGVERLHRL